MSGAAPERVWFVTGASAGFGRTLCEEILRRGDRVVATARSPGQLADLAVLAPERVLVQRLDVTQPQEIASAVRAAEERFGRLDVLVNNAGYGFLSGLEEGSDAEMRAQFEVNVFGLVAVTRAVLALLRRQRSGYIVNLSSVAGVYGVAGSAYYSASKFAVEGLSESLAKEVKPFGIGVLIVEPGPFRTDFFGRSMATPRSPLPEYAVLAEQRRGLGAMSGRQPGDPVRAAAAIVDAVCEASPRLRLVLGGGACERVRQALEKRLAEVQASRAVAESVDFPEVP
jgi:NAD(P)-dependent dehydrogenase (short-subunit alcohol dehydrogenase family)